VRGTHTELTDPELRLILANEILVLRFQMKRMAKMKLPMSKDTYSSIVMGLDTALRRVQDVREHGMENVYRQFYPEKEKKQ
jgi:hypothetical protein